MLRCFHLYKVLFLPFPRSDQDLFLVEAITPMTEKLLQFIWKHRYFNQQKLELTTGESMTIDYPGELNTYQGPDFVNARIRINGHCWIGSVELHLYSS